MALPDLIHNVLTLKHDNHADEPQKLSEIKL